MARFINTPDNDSLTGTDGPDVFDFAAGQTGAGDDYFDGGAGRDTAFGGVGSDVFYGGTGADALYGGADIDYFYLPTTDADRIFGGGGEFDYLFLTGGPEGVTVDMTAGTAGRLRFEDINYVTGTGFDDTMTGGVGNDNLHGSNGRDVMRGNQGDDYLGMDYFGATDRDTGFGGVGNDYLQSSGHGDRAFGGRGTDLLQFVTDNDVTITLGGGRRVAEVAGAGRTIFRSFEDLQTAGGDDSLTGSRRDNVLRSFDGNDTVSGGAGNDQLDGGGGSDSLNGGKGLDYLYGGDGRDQLTGGLGADFHYGGAGGDRFIFTDTTDSAPAARDSILDFARGDRIDLRDLQHSGGLGPVDVDLTWIGGAAFSSTGDEVRYEDGRLYIRMNSLWGLEMEIVVTGDTVRQQDVLL